MPRSLGRHQIGYSQRSARKVRARDLVYDGELRNVLVARDEKDEKRRPFVVPVDRIHQPLPGPNGSEPVSILVGFEGTTNLWDMPRGYPGAMTINMGHCLLSIVENTYVNSYLLTEAGAYLVTELGDRLVIGSSIASSTTVDTIV